MLLVALLAKAGGGAATQGPGLQPPNWLVLAIVLPVFLLVAAAVAALAFARSPLAQLPGPPWRVRPRVKLRTTLSRRELIQRLTRFCESRATPHERRRNSIAAAQIGTSTFAIEFAHGSVRYIVRGRILERVDERLVLLSFDRPARLWLFVVTASAIATAIWAGIEVSVDPSFLFVWLLLPLFGLIPADFFIPVSDELRDLVGANEDDVPARMEGG